MIDTAWSGESFSTRVWGNTEELARRIRGEAQEMVMGLKSPATVKQQLMKDYDVSFRQASRLVDTELSYVLNKANLEEYRRRGRKKLTITNLDVKAASPGLAGFAKGETADGSNRRFEARHLYTCDKCKALEGEVFFTEDVPVLPIHPRCHCAYCVPDDLDAAEVTASGEDLDAVYARHERPEGTKGVRSEGLAARSPLPAAGRGNGAVGVKGYGDGDAPKQYVPKQQRAAEVARANGLIPASELQAKVEKAMAQTAPELAEKGTVAAGEMPTETGEVSTETGEVPTAVMEVLKQAREVLAEDITDHFVAEGSPGVGNLIIPEDYNHGKHAGEIDAAKTLVREIGGDIELINESKKNQESSADYRWRDKLWELKSPEKLNGLDKLVHKGMHQIAEDPGGLVIRLPEGVSLDDAEKIVKHMAGRSKMRRLTTIFLQAESLVKVALYIKK